MRIALQGGKVATSVSLRLGVFILVAFEITGIVSHRTRKGIVPGFPAEEIPLDSLRAKDTTLLLSRGVRMSGHLSREGSTLLFAAPDGASIRISSEKHLLDSLCFSPAGPELIGRNLNLIA